MTDIPLPPPLVPVTGECVVTAAQTYRIHPDILLALLLVEGGTVGGKPSPNTNSTHDIGIAQFNTDNLAYLYEEYGITKKEVNNNGCLAVAVMAQHLVRSIKGAAPITDEKSYLLAIARYHSKTPIHGNAYAEKLRLAFNHLHSLDGESK